jgi:hypothetical protein
MAVFDVNTVCWRVVHDDDFCQTLREDPALALRDTDVSDEERNLLLAGDVKSLYELGVSGFLMEHLANKQLLGLNPVVYSERIRQAEWHAV